MCYVYISNSKNKKMPVNLEKPHMNNEIDRTQEAALDMSDVPRVVASKRWINDSNRPEMGPREVTDSYTDAKGNEWISYLDESGNELQTMRHTPYEIPSEEETKIAQKEDADEIMLELETIFEHIQDDESISSSNNELDSKQSPEVVQKESEDESDIEQQVESTVMHIRAAENDYRTENSRNISHLKNAEEQARSVKRKLSQLSELIGDSAPIKQYARRLENEIAPFLSYVNRATSEENNSKAHTLKIEFQKSKIDIKNNLDNDEELRSAFTVFSRQDIYYMSTRELRSRVDSIVRLIEVSVDARRRTGFECSTVVNEITEK